jgi:putative membrane protein
MTLQKMAASAGLAVGVATAGCGIAATIATPAVAASPAVATARLTAGRTAQSVSSQDRMFLDQASQVNLTEISLGGYMHGHAVTSVARNLGAVYARDHTAAQADLKALASRLHVTVPSTLNPQFHSMVARVEAESGRSRDVAFAEGSVSGHKAAIAVFKKEETAGSNPQVKAYAARYLPMLRTHLRLAEHAVHALGGTPAK